MDAMVITVLIGAFVCGGVLLESLAPHLPVLLGLERPAGGPAPVRGGSPRVRGAGQTASELTELERRVDELEAERDFYKALAEPRTLTDHSASMGESR